MSPAVARPDLGLNPEATIRILVVEDFPAFRQFICLTLGMRRDLHIIGEAADGLAAVQKAVELKPDLILMDIGLPSLSGIEAARQIRRLVPESKIIFLSQETSAEVVQEALSVGAQGYVVKAKAGNELLACIQDAILERPPPAARAVLRAMFQPTDSGGQVNRRTNRKVCATILHTECS